MKKRNLIAFSAAAVLLAACVPSVNPFYTDKDLVFDQRLVGEWQEPGKTNDAEVWKFEPSINKMYKLTLVESQGNTGTFDVHLFQLKQEQFLDLIPNDCKYASNQASLVEVSMFPGHLLMHVSQIEPSLKLSFFNFDWLSKYLKANPKALSVHAEHGENGPVVITADTPDLQKFVLKHLGTNELFDKPGELVRRQAGASK